jgi:hypothetical protein
MSRTAAGRRHHWRQALPWCGLVCLSLAGAQGVQAVAASLLAPAPALGVVGSASHARAEGQGQVPDRAGSGTVVVVLTLRDPSTGSGTDYLCRMTRDRAVSDALVVDADTAREVAQSLCDALWPAAPVVAGS